MQVHHPRGLRVTDQEMNMFVNWNSSRMSHQIQDLQTEDRCNPQMYFPAFQDKQKMQVSQPEHLRVTNQEVNVFIHRNNNQMYHIIHNLLLKKQTHLEPSNILPIDKITYIFRCFGSTVFFLTLSPCGLKNMANFVM